MKRIINQFKNSTDVLITTHTEPDGDGIGSMIALGLALDAMGKNITFFNESPIPAVYRFLPFVNLIRRHFDEVDYYDLLIVVDCGQLQRIGKAESFIRHIPVTINLDHHSTNDHFGDYQLIDTSACATTEIIYRLLKEMDAPINNAMAMSIYTGILADTGSFRFSNTNQAAFEICKEMVEIGVDPFKVAQYVYGTYSLGRIKLLNRALDSIEISKNGRLSIMTLTKEMFEETGTSPEDIDGFINYAKQIESVKVAALILEQLHGEKQTGNMNKFHISLRSDGTVDVASIAASYGGGGHYSASGFSVEAKLSKIKSEIKKMAYLL